MTILRILALSSALFFTPMLVGNSIDTIRLANTISHRSGIGETEAIKFAVVIIRESTDKGLDPIMVAAIIQVESKFRNLSGKYGTGLMQVVHRYHVDKVKTKNELKNPEKNIEVGTTILQRCNRSSGTVTSMLRCYNGGANSRYSRQVMIEMSKMTTHITM